MDIPKDRKLFEHTIATFWFDEKGILYSVSKQAPRTLETMKDYIAFVKEMTHHQKVCILTDVSKTGQMDKQTKEYTALELKNVYKAMAIVSDSWLGIMIVNLFFQVTKADYPVKMFSDEKYAKKWLEKHLVIEFQE
jgi:hypothetical protein